MLDKIYVFDDIIEKDYQNKINNLLNLSNSAKKTLKIDQKILNIGKIFAEAKGSMFLGRGFSFPIALEGALTVSYTHLRAHETV